MPINLQNLRKSWHFLDGILIKIPAKNRMNDSNWQDIFPTSINPICDWVFLFLWPISYTLIDIIALLSPTLNKLAFYPGQIFKARHQRPFTRCRSIKHLSLFNLIFTNTLVTFKLDHLISGRLLLAILKDVKAVTALTGVIFNEFFFFFDILSNANNELRISLKVQIYKLN